MIVHSLGPFMILPGAQTEAMSIFKYRSIQHLNVHSCESWQNTLMFFAHTVPAVWHAAVALGSIQRNYLDRSENHRQDDTTPLFHYNRAIQLLLNQTIEDSTETTAITLLVCYLFTCFDHLAGNYVQAVSHLRGGVELLRNIDRAMLAKNNAREDVRTLICEVSKQIRRLDIQAIIFLIDWTPADIQETPVPQFTPPDSAFRSLNEAADRLHILVAQVMKLRNTEQKIPPMGTVSPPVPSPIKDILFRQLTSWLCIFANMLQQGNMNSNNTGSQSHRLISLLRVQHTIACILLHCSGPGREIDYDNFLPEFQQSIALARDAAAVNEPKGTFTPEVGIIPVLYTIGVKCRHPAIRREVLRILRQQPMREAVWDSFSAARVVERVIEIEENVSEGRNIQGMEQIAVWQRVETVSWVQSGAKLDLAYTFCGREGMRTEVLSL